jgi:hypothetical protein
MRLLKEQYIVLSLQEPHMYCPFRNLICIVPSVTSYVLSLQEPHMYCHFRNLICIVPSGTSYVLPLRFLKGQYIWDSWSGNTYEVTEGTIHMRLLKEQYIVLSLQEPHMYCPFRNLICIVPSVTSYVLSLQEPHMYYHFRNLICITTSGTSYIHMRFLKGQYIWGSWSGNTYEVPEGTIHMRFLKGQYIWGSWSGNTYEVPEVVIHIICIVPSGISYVLPLQESHMYCPFSNLICIATSGISYVLSLQ